MAAPTHRASSEALRFCSLRISNLRAVRRFEIGDLKDFIVIAGQNGSGKSCVFDAIRLLKSVYGGYATDEHMQWFGEFAINPADRVALKSVFRDPNAPLEITAAIEYSDSETEFLIANAADLIWPIAWQRVTGQRIDHWTFNQMAIATQLGQHRTAVEARVAEIREDLVSALRSSRQHQLEIDISPDGDMNVADCTPAEVAFQAYQPAELGVIEYHSASRAYIRQPLQGINLDARAFEDQRRQQRLYNWQGKYQNVKTELASGYLRSLIAQASGQNVSGEDLNETLKELFRVFFPDKEYEGVRPMPGGGLEFPVRLRDGAMHDIDELSSGEKEILYGYLRLRNSTPKRSVILIDEPELHLNPSLLQGFADFYYRHIGEAQENQLWLVTHSDALLRQAIGNSNYCVYHMVTATTPSENQASEILLDDDLERAVVDLVGDLAAYHPHAKVVILEGAHEDGFDRTLVSRLFPEFARRVNLVSGGSKRRVRDLHEILSETTTGVGMTNRFFAIVDKDAQSYTMSDSTTHVFTWDVYHVENYLLNPSAIRQACVTLLGNDPFGANAGVLSALNEDATRLVDRLILREMQAEVNSVLVRAIDIGGPPHTNDAAGDIFRSMTGSMERVASGGAAYTLARLQARGEELRATFDAALASDAWLREFPGREILKQFAAHRLPGVNYEPFRNAVLDKISLSEDRPSGMQDVLERILSAP